MKPRVTYMSGPSSIAKRTAVKARAVIYSLLLSYPRKIQCNVCGWKGRHLESDKWHRHVNCPRCHSKVRHRLFFAALQNMMPLSFDKIIRNKDTLHFAPENIVSNHIKDKASRYVTADFLRQDCDLQLDMSNMPEIGNESFGLVIAFDVLEHVPDYQKALEEVHRILSVNGFAVFTVPQKDYLEFTYEDPAMVTAKERENHFGQWDHLRIFGNDFPNTIEAKGFKVTAVDESMFPEDVRVNHVLFPPELSSHPLATNFRKVFFCEKLP